MRLSSNTSGHRRRDDGFCLDGLGGLTLTGQVTPDQSFKALTAAPGLEVKLWAAEPDVINPSVIAVDALTRTGPTAVRAAAVRALGMLNAPDAEARARALMLSDAANDVRSEALRLMVRSAEGLNALSDLEEKGQFPLELKALARTLVSGRGGRGFVFAGRGAPAAAGRAAAAILIRLL